MMQKIWHRRKQNQAEDMGTSCAPKIQDHLQALRASAIAAGLDTQPAAPPCQMKQKDPQPPFVRQQTIQIGQDWTVPNPLSVGRWQSDADKEARRHMIANM